MRIAKWGAKELRDADFGLRNRERTTNHGPRNTSYEKAHWPNKAISSQDQGGEGETWACAASGVWASAAWCARDGTSTSSAKRTHGLAKHRPRNTLRVAAGRAKRGLAQACIGYDRRRCQSRVNSCRTHQKRSWLTGRLM